MSLDGNINLGLARIRKFAIKHLTAEQVLAVAALQNIFKLFKPFKCITMQPLTGP